jgi:spore germination protein YaaH
VLIQAIGAALHAAKKRLVLVVPPARGGTSVFGPELASALAGDVDWYSLMTYDYSGPGRPGPNAPLDWVRASVHACACVCVLMVPGPTGCAAHCARAWSAACQGAPGP